MMWRARPSRDSSPATIISACPSGYSLVSDPTHGNLTFNSDGSYSYTSDSTFGGTDSFSFKVNNGVLDSKAASVNVARGRCEDHRHARHDTFTALSGTGSSPAMRPIPSSQLQARRRAHLVRRQRGGRRYRSSHYGAERLSIYQVHRWHGEPNNDGDRLVDDLFY